MNIFVLDTNPKLAAQYHCDKHVVKMCIETAQLLSTAVQLELGRIPELYRITHKNHPCRLWVSASTVNFHWTAKLAEHLLDEYSFRYDKEHATRNQLELILQYSAQVKFPVIEQTPFVQCLPEDLRSSDPVEAYRAYYIRDKARFATWKKRSVPEWFKNG